MRVQLRRPPTLLEQLVGRRRAKALRRRLGFLAIGAGASMLRPRPTWTPLAMTGVAALALVVVLGIRAA